MFMHIYIYDSSLANKKHDSSVAKIETRITDLGLNGKIIRLNLLQSLLDSIHDEIKKGAKTIVAVGDNALLHNCINAVISFYSKSSLSSSIPVGFIPIGKNTSLAKNFGIPSGIDACNVLSARRIKPIDLGKINNNYFLSEAIITTVGTTVNVDKSYSIELNEIGEIAIVNIPHSFTLPSSYKSSAQDGRLEFCIKTKKTNRLLSIGNKETATSVFAFDELVINNNQKQTLLLDLTTKISTPANIKVSQKKLNLIIGRGSGL